MMKVKFDYSILERAYNIYIYEEIDEERVQPYEIKLRLLPMEHGFQPMPKAAQLKKKDTDTVVRALIEGLTEAGFIKRESHATDAELVATQRHLEDFRKLVFEPRPTGQVINNIETQNVNS